MKPELVAHRGASLDAPENTMAAMELAWRQGSAAVELDVHQSRDGHLIVIHDESVDRTTDGRGKIAELTAEEIGRLDAGAWKDARFAGIGVPRLEEVLGAAPEGARFFVEIKGPTVSIPRLAAALAGLRPGRLVVMSFSKSVAAAAKKAFPSHLVLWLCECPSARPPSFEELIAEAKQENLDGLSLSQQWPIDAQAVRRIRDAGLSIYVWTVDGMEEARKLAEAGVDGIISNRAAWLGDRLAEAVLLRGAQSSLQVERASLTPAP